MPHVHQRINEMILHLLRVKRGGGNAELFLTSSHGGVVDVLDVNTIFVHELARGQRGAFGITNLGRRGGREEGRREKSEV